MNEEIEYAEMLEIPVSTVNVVKKKNRRVRGKNQPNLKERLISRVNNRVGNASYAPEDAAIESAPASALEQNPVYASAENAALEDAAQNAPLAEPDFGAYAYAEGGERLDTVLLSDEGGRRAKKKRRWFAAKEQPEYADFQNDEEDFSENDGTMALTKPKESRKSGIILTVEFAVACLLCGGIFLTNVFMPTSAINTFFRGLMPAKAEKEDTRVYSDFTLMAAANSRTTQLQRYRQRFMHKLVYYPAQHEGLYSCVGCGRCVNKCPQRLNIVKVIKTLGGKAHD